MRLTDKDLRICLFAYALTAVSVAWGHEQGPEYIDSFDTALSVRNTGAVDVTHVIDVHPHGDEIRRGLFFELPEDVGALSDFSVRLGGEPIEPDFDDGALIAAADAPLPEHQIHRFVIRYRAAAPWWRTADGELRLRWSPVIEQFELAWRTASLEVRWPPGAEPVALPDSGLRDGNSWRIALNGPDSADPASERVGRIELRWPASAMPPESVRRYGSDPGWRVGLVLGLLALLGYLHSAWRRVGRDPETGPASPQSSPPHGLSPAAARFVERMGWDDTVFVAALVSLRVQGAVELDVDAESLRVERRQEARVDLSPGERAVCKALFNEAESVTLTAGDSRASRASEALRKALGKEHRGRHFVDNRTQQFGGILAGLVLVGAAVVALVLQAQDAFSPDPVTVGIALLALLTGIVAPLIYFELLKAPTRAGADVKRQLAGLKRFFSEGSPDARDATQFVRLLPYAIALGQEKEWRARFDADLEADAEGEIAAVLDWYREIQRSHDTAGAIVPVLAATSATSSATAGGGASAGGV